MRDGERLPDFFIVGAARAGTTSLWRYLEEHPEVYMPATFLQKEPSYFSDLFGMQDTERYLSLFRGASRNQRVGEASTAYLTDPAAAARLRDAVPDARIIILLRNPVERAYSLYNWMTQEGYEFALNFEAALEREDGRLAAPPARWMDAYYYNYLYRRSGLYHEQVKRYLELFPSDNVAIWLFEELVEKPAAIYRQVCRFLDVSDDRAPRFERYNPSRSAVFPPLQVALRKVNDLVTRVRRAVGWLPCTKEDRDFLVRLGTRNRRPPPLDSGLRQRLLSFFRDDIERLEELICRSFQEWLDD